MTRKLLQQVEMAIQSRLRYNDQTECLVWEGKADERGRPIVGVGPRREEVLVRSFIYEQMNETTVGAGVEVRPTCGNARCCQGEHLGAFEVDALLEHIEHIEHIELRPAEIGGWSVEISSDETERREERLKTHCPAGHEFTQENTVVRKNGKGQEGRACRQCIRAANQRAAQKRKERVSDAAG